MNILVKDYSGLFSSGYKYIYNGYGGNYTMEFLVKMYGFEKAKEIYSNQEQNKLKIIKN